MYFDARTARQLRPGEHMIVDGCPGLRLVAAPKWKSWVYRYKDPAGRMRQMAFGRWPDVSAAEAVARWQAMRDGRAAGADPVAMKRQARAVVQPGVTVADMLREYLRDVLAGSRSEASYRAADRAVARLLAEDPAFGAAAPDSITRARAFDLLAARAGTPTAAAKLRSLLGAAWDHALDAGRIADAPNWWRQIMRGKLRSRGKIVGGKHQGRQHAVLTLAECGQILAWAADNMHPHGQDMLVMYLWTGARGAELMRMDRAHLRVHDGVLWWTLPKALTKNAAVPRAVDLRLPILGRARDVVMRRMAAADPFWPSARGKPYTQKAFSTAVYDLMPDSPKGRRRGVGWPVTGWSAHRLRATVRTLLAGLGCPRDVGEAIMGHVSPEVEGTYNRHHYDAEKLRWLGLLADQLDAVAPLPRRP